jgi:hypothetical protein
MAFLQERTLSLKACASDETRCSGEQIDTKLVSSRATLADELCPQRGRCLLACLYPLNADASTGVSVLATSAANETSPRWASLTVLRVMARLEIARHFNVACCGFNRTRLCYYVTRTVWCCTCCLRHQNFADLDFTDQSGPRFVTRSNRHLHRVSFASPLLLTKIFCLPPPTQLNFKYLIIDILISTSHPATTVTIKYYEYFVT